MEEQNTYREQRNHLGGLFIVVEELAIFPRARLVTAKLNVHILLTKRSLLTGFLPFTFGASVLRAEQDQ